jgi:hypothetical protein
MASEKQLGHDHGLPSPATHSHSRPATRPEQCTLVQIHLQLVAELLVLSVTSSRELGHQQHGHDLLEHIQAIAKLRPALYSPCIMNPESPNMDTPIYQASV